MSGELVYMKNSMGAPLNAPPMVLTNYEIKPDASGVQLKSSSQSVNSIIMLNSTDRDRNAYRQPTNVTLRLPRVYTNVTSFQLVQIKLLSAFYYFRPSKQNTSISILENGRANNGLDAIVKSFIRQGTYDINSLLSEITTQLNVTPLFYDFPNGFQDFALRFSSTGDFFLNFNQPGDNYYDSLADIFIPNPTVTTIISRYFENQYAGLSSYTTDQLKVAYYYPVLKEVLLDPGIVPINLDVSAGLFPGETPYNRVIYTFQGIDDPVILAIINLNFEPLDKYRLLHTFRYGLVNKYTATLQAQSNKITIATTSLNTSLVNLLANKQAQYQSEELSKNNLSAAQFATLQTQNNLLLAVVNDMFYFLQKYLATYFGIAFNTYDISYIANPNYYVPIRDATGAIGISSNFDSSVISRNTLPIKTNITSQFQQGSPNYWPGLSNIDVLARPFNLDPASNHPYSVRNDVFDTEHYFVDLCSEQLYVNPLLRYADIVIPLDPEKYTIFKFKSPVRQTLQIETLPRPTKSRYLYYNYNYPQDKQQLFDNSYSYVWNQSDLNLDWILYHTTPDHFSDLPGYSFYDTNNFGSTYQLSVGYWLGDSIKSYVGNNIALYQIYTPTAPGQVPENYRYSLSITITTINSSNFVTPMKMFIYHDRAAALADIKSNGNESAFNYNTSATTTIDISASTVTFDVYPKQYYYILSRPVNNISPTQSYRIVAWFKSGGYTPLTSSLDGFDPLADPSTPQALLNTNYAHLADPAFIHLPISSNLIPSTKIDPLYTPLTYSTIAIGYDASGVSNDATDYFGYTPYFPNAGNKSASSFRIDPTNGYIMQKISDYDPVAQSYFYTGSQNAILTPGGASLYTPGRVAKREISIIHPYYTHYLASSENQAPIPTDPGLVSPTNLPAFTSSSTTVPIGGYSYGGSNVIQLGDGVMGISFVPDQGVWNIERAMFAAYWGGGVDVNQNIKYLGVFLVSSLPSNVGPDPNNPYGFFQYSNSLVVLKFSSLKYYTSIQENADNYGFGVDPGAGFYEFTRDYSYKPQTNQNIYGYSQIRREFNPDTNSIYTLVPFDEYYQISRYNGLIGSLIPYPIINKNTVDVSDTYFDGNTTPNGKQLLIPTGVPHPLPPVSAGGPPDGYDETQSQYEQSMPVGTTVIHYLIPYDFLLNPNAMRPWIGPSVTTNAVFDNVGYLITFDSVFHVYSYPTDFSQLNFAIKEHVHGPPQIVNRMNARMNKLMAEPPKSNPLVFKEVYQFTIDQIMDPTANSAYIGMASNAIFFVFFSYSVDALLYVTVMDSEGGYSSTGGQIIQNFSIQSPFDFTRCNLISATVNNDFGFSLSVNDTSGVSHVYYQKYYGADGMIIEYVSQDPAVDSMIAKQSAQTSQYVTSPLYIFLSSGGMINSFAILTFNTDTNVIDPRFRITGSQGNMTLVVYTLNDNYISPIVTRSPFKDIISFLRPGFGSIYQVTGYNGTTAITTPSAYNFPGTPTALYQGGAGSKWALYDGTIYGNRGGTFDAPNGIDAGWQIFYPMQRIVFTKVANNFTFMQDKTNLEYPEYPHTAIAVYDSLAKLQGDLGDVTNPDEGRWGMETSGNILAADFGFSGEAFGASVFSVPLQVSEPGSYYYAAIRNYSPTEKSQVILRCSLNNRYDFGYVKLPDLSGEVGLSATSSNLFSPEYYKQLIGFNSNFIYAEKTFGANIIKGFNGSNFTNLTGFGDFYNRFVNLYATYNNQVQLVQSITSNVNSNINAFIQADLKNILPASAQYRQRFTDPLTFSILWKSSLSREYAKLEDQWGLGWNLGYDKVDTPYSTVHTAPSFFKILDDYINLRLNPEYDMNRVDSGSKENLFLTQDTTGSTKAFHAKLLLASFGSYAQTLISNPVSFSPPLGRMDKLTFQWLDPTESVIDNSDCEWNVVIQVVEKKEIVEIPKPALVYQGRT